MRPCRNGFTLLEVLLATAILAGSAIVLTSLAGIGTRSALAAEELEQATRLCRTRLDELLAGLAPLVPAQEAPLAPNSDWSCSVTIEPVRHAALEMAELRVTVSRAADTGRRPVRVSLVRWIAVPQTGTSAQSSAVVQRRSATTP